MPVQIGQKPDSNFDNPLQLLSDCHRRIETFLGVLEQVANECGSRPLSSQERQSFERALHYFQNSAPKHTADEEDSLFPRLRASEHPSAQTLLERMELLEAEHITAAADHEIVDSLGRQLLENGLFGQRECAEFREVVNRLSEMYRHHIGVEDSELFPLAARVLSGEERASIGREMARRRGIKR